MPRWAAHAQSILAAVRPGAADTNKGKEMPAYKKKKKVPVSSSGIFHSVLQFDAFVCSDIQVT